jgi:hypothetical protein
MTDKLIAIVRFKNLKGIRPTTRFGVFESPDIRCGPASAPTGCAFWRGHKTCNSACGNTDSPNGADLSKLYFLRVSPTGSGRFVVKRSR